MHTCLGVQQFSVYISGNGASETMVGDLCKEIPNSRVVEAYMNVSGINQKIKFQSVAM